MYHYAGNNPINYVDPDGNTDTKYGITYITYKDYYIQEKKPTNRNPGYMVQEKYVREKTTITYYGNSENILEMFQKKNTKENRMVWDCDESYLLGDVKEILKEKGSNVIVETEKITTTSNYMGVQGTEKTQESPEKIKAIYFINDEGEITKVIKNEEENK